MKLVNYLFYYTYVGMVVLAGFWGAFINPGFDYKLLFHFDVHSLADFPRVNMLSQYRFLRAIELGFGIFSLVFVKNIFSEKKFNSLFLIIMALGISARITSIIADGSPSGLMYFFLLFELIALTVIIFYSRKKLQQSAGIG